MDDYRSWLMKHVRRRDFRNVTAAVDAYDTFSTASRRNVGFFDGTAFYAVGSSLKRKDYHDIDFVVVGLYLMPATDFEAVEAENEIVEDPDEGLVELENEVVMEPSLEEPVIKDLNRMLRDVFPERHYDHYDKDVFDANPLLIRAYEVKNRTDGFPVRRHIITPKDRDEAPVDFMIYDDKLSPYSWEKYQNDNKLPFIKISGIGEPLGSKDMKLF
jgi:hypothetical protein